MTLAFDEVFRGSRVAASLLAPVVAKQAVVPECVALLCTSTVDFLFAWLGLMELGLTVLLIAYSTFTLLPGVI